MSRKEDTSIVNPRDKFSEVQADGDHVLVCDNWGGSCKIVGYERAITLDTLVEPERKNDSSPFRSLDTRASIMQETPFIVGSVMGKHSVEGLSLFFQGKVVPQMVVHKVENLANEASPISTKKFTLENVLITSIQMSFSINNVGTGFDVYFTLTPTDTREELTKMQHDAVKKGVIAFNTSSVRGTHKSG